jgi:hypothetical protein
VDESQFLEAPRPLESSIGDGSGSIHTKVPDAISRVMTVASKVGIVAQRHGTQGYHFSRSKSTHTLTQNTLSRCLITKEPGRTFPICPSTMVPSLTQPKFPLIPSVLSLCLSSSILSFPSLLRLGLGLGLQ